jgi:SWI/SNF-related matrix-associated actin-dependent regulator 1 of chromatin subfamily A
VLRNPKSQRYERLIKIPADFRLLLTGTPLQNNLLELAALLGFILPEIFRDRQEELDFIFKHKASTRDSDHAALLSSQRITRAKSMLTPFVLRRKKDQVLKHMPTKTCRVEYCDLHPSQTIIYDGLREKARERARLRLEGARIPSDGENNPLMQLRKAAIHPMLFRRHFTDEKVQKMLALLKKNEPTEFREENHKHLIKEMLGLSDWYLHIWCQLHPCISKFDVPDLAWMNSGKVAVLVRLLEVYKENGDRVLIFSQFTLVLDILEAILETSRIQFTRIDGMTKVNERQTIIDDFRDDKTTTAFLLSTGAGGTGLNLMFANKVIIFDSSFNPQDDIQAENRAHRVGQTRDVEVVRLVTKGTIEEQIYALGQTKLALDSKVAGHEGIEAKGEELVAKLLLEEELKEVPVKDEGTMKTEVTATNAENPDSKATKSEVASQEKRPSRVRLAKEGKIEDDVEEKNC